MTTADDARRALAEAFPDKSIDPADAFTEWGVTYLDGDTFIAGVVGRGWRTLTSAFLEEHEDALYFLGPKAFANLLPAYAQAMFDPVSRDSVLPETLLAVLSPPRRQSDLALWEKRHAARMKVLSHEQREALLKALTALGDTGDPELAVGAAKAAKAITDYVS